MRYFTKEWYLACQTVPMTQALQRQLQETGEAYRAAQAREALPDELRQHFHFHDGVVREVCAGTDYTLRIDSPFSGYHSVTFHNALIRQEQPPVGAVWLLLRCSEVRLLEQTYSPGCMLRRNRAMVDAADALLTVFDGAEGGTAATIRYARRLGREIIPLWL